MSRIVYVCADRGIPVFGEKGASIHLQEMVRAFAALGHELRVVCVRRGDTPVDLHGATVEEIAPPPAFGPNRADIERQAIAAARAVEARLLELHDAWPFDMIYERYSLWSAAGCRAARQLRVPSIVEVNAPLVQEQSEYRQLDLIDEARTIEAEVFSTADMLAAVSRQLTGYLAAHGARSDNVQVIGNAVNRERFHPTVPRIGLPGLRPDHFVVGFTGSLKLWHGIDTLLVAFRAFRARHQQARLLIVGDGPKRGWAEGFVAGAELERDVIFTGWVPHEALPGLIVHMDVATAPYPAADDHYFSPLKLYEYLAVGRPVLASQIGQCADLLSGSDAALLVPPGDPRALAGALTDLHADPVRRQRMAAAAATEGARHDWRENARTIAALAKTLTEAA